ncbi:hypothetical protein [Pedobacter alpinus]|uniref:Uncharacterized protein n=1 Tax=Pedobacter alpinus TaxID=1590643 RepID=A0ABW5TU88_9SPHI
MIKFFYLFIIVILFSGCNSCNEPTTRKQIYYFDLQAYFGEQAVLLKNKSIVKTVAKNKVAEKQNLIISNWEQEFSLFTESDINKAAWKDSYTKDSTANKIKYTAKEVDLRVRSIEINLQNLKPSKITIVNQGDNYLYHTTDTLTYIPDSLYQIKKHQKVILLGLNNYVITGLIK